MFRWSSAFARFLKGLDDRWPKLLGKLEQMKGMPVTSQLEEAWAWELWTGDLMPWKEQLFQLLECYTAGDVAKFVVAGEERGVFTTWSRMADKGHSLRLEHITDLRRKACAQRTSFPAKDLELAVALWEKDVSLYADASGNCSRPKT